MNTILKQGPTKLAFTFLFVLSISLPGFAAERNLQNDDLNRSKNKAVARVIVATNSFDFDFLGNFINLAALSGGGGSAEDIETAFNATNSAIDAVLTPDVIGMVGLGFGETRVSGRSFGREEYFNSIFNMAGNIIAPEIVPNGKFFKQFRHRVDSVKSYQGGKFATAELSTFLFVADFNNDDPETWLPAYAWRCVFQYREVDGQYMIEHIIAAGVPVASIDNGSAVNETWYLNGGINPYYLHLEENDD